MADRIPSAILTYHALDDSGRLFSTPPAVFRRQIAALIESGLRPVPLDAVWETAGSFSLTFDDGLRSFRELALPLLLEHRLPATLFVVSGFCGRARGWRSSPAPDSADVLLDWEELRDIAAAGIAIGAHTVSHPSLTGLSDDRALQEMRDSRREIEDRIGKPVTGFAYPYGHTDERIRQLAAGEFLLACGTELAMLDPDSDRFNLPRIFEFYLRSPFWLRRLGTLEGRAYVALRRLIAQLRA